MVEDQAPGDWTPRACSQTMLFSRMVARVKRRKRVMESTATDGGGDRHAHLEGPGTRRGRERTPRTAARRTALRVSSEGLVGGRRVVCWTAPFFGFDMETPKEAISYQLSAFSKKDRPEPHSSMSLLPEERAVIAKKPGAT